MATPLAPSLKKYFGILVLGCAAVCAHFQASAAMQLLAAAITLPDLSFGTLAANTSTPSSPSPPPKSAKAILARNAFDSLTGPIDLEPRPSDSIRAKLDLTDPLSAALCTDTKAFITTESTDPRWSIAALQGPGELTPKLRRRGDEVGGKRVAHIGFNPKYQSPSVWLTGDATLCQTPLFVTAVPVPQASPASSSTDPSIAVGSKTSAASGTSRLPQELASKIQRVSANEFRLDRAMVDKVLSEPQALAQSGQALPDVQGGKVVGIKLRGVRRDTLLDAIGLKNGDRIESINGFGLESPERILEAYTRLRAAERLKLQVNRGGQATTLEYEIR